MKKLLFNPFVPNSIPSATLFSGRQLETQNAEFALIQAKNKIPENFLFKGERGIGKTALLHHIRDVASGKFKSPVTGEHYNFFCVYVDISSCNTQEEIIQQMLSETKTQIENLKESESIKNILDFLSRFEIKGIKYNKDQGTETTYLSELRKQFVKLIEKCVQNSFLADGFLFLIDEADTPPSNANLGQFLKSVCESLSRTQCKSVIFGLAGLPEVTAKLRQSHKSSPRLFQIHSLATLTLEEQNKAVQNCLQFGDKINSTKTTISKKAMEYLCELSEGYPHFLQQFGHSAFNIHENNEITIEHVQMGAHMSGGALSQIGEKYFSHMYHNNISSDGYRKVLNIMALHGNRWIKKSELAEYDNINNLTNALKTLVQKKIIDKDSTRKGYYRLKTKSFAMWIQLIVSKDLDKKS